MRVDTACKYVLTLFLLFDPLAVYDVTTARLLLFSTAALFEIGPGWLTQSEQFLLDQTEDVFTSYQVGILLTTPSVLVPGVISSS
jgi:hypothetical protein